MKEFVVTGGICLFYSGACAQGTLQFFNDFIDLKFQVFAPNPNNPAVQQIGETVDQGPISGISGPYTSYGGIPIGGSLFSGTAPATIDASSPLYADGNLFTAQIYASAAGDGTGAIPAFSSLSPVSQYIDHFFTFNGAPNANLDQVEPVPDRGIPGTGYDGSGLHGATHILNNANVAIAAWYNGGGIYTTLAEAKSAGVPWGASQVVVVENLGEPSSVETTGLGRLSTATLPAEPYGIESFSLIVASGVSAAPEPGTIALGVMGVGAFLARRRKK